MYEHVTSQLRTRGDEHDQLLADASATLENVARVAGVSTATVSRVINNLPTVAPGTRQRVLDAVAQLHYTPNFAGRSLVTRRTKTLGLIITDITNPFYPAIVRGVEAAALALGFSVLLYDTADDKQREAQALQLLGERQVDGLVVCSSRLGKARLAQIAHGKKIPIIFINSTYAPDTVGTVETDHEYGMRMAVEHLSRLGHTHIAYLGGPPASQVQQRRLAAFRQYCDEFRLSHTEVTPVPTVAGGEAGTRALLSDAAPGTRPTAVIMYNDLMAAGALVAARSCGLVVPRDLSVIGHDDIPMAALLTPTLTSVRQPTQELGARAVNMLVAQLHSGTKANPVLLSLRPELIVRDSTAAPGR